MTACGVHIIAIDGIRQYEATMKLPKPLLFKGGDFSKTDVLAT
jgi:uncharacterized protein with PIN domain